MGRGVPYALMGLRKRIAEKTPRLLLEELKPMSFPPHMLLWTRGNCLKRTWTTEEQSGPQASKIHRLPSESQAFYQSGDPITWNLSVLFKVQPHRVWLLGFRLRKIRNRLEVG